MKKKLSILFLAFAMILSFAACGGGGSDSAASDNAQGSAAEPNAGIAGIVFAVPDDWTQGNITPGSYIEYKIPGSDYSFTGSAFGDKELEERNTWSEGEKFDSVQAFYDKHYVVDDKTLKERDCEKSSTSVYGNDAVYIKFNAGTSNYYELSTFWMDDNTIYQLTLFNPKTYDENGKFDSSAAAANADEIAAYEAVIASVQKGDGNAFQQAALESSATSIGSIAFDKPEGYTVSMADDSWFEFKKDGSDIFIQISMTDEDQLQNIELPDGSHPSSLKEYYEQYDSGDEESAATIAGYDGHIFKYPFDDDKYYDVNADFMTEDAVYNVSMNSNAWDENGNIKDGAEGLSEEDLAVFDAFVASLRKK